MYDYIIQIYTCLQQFLLPLVLPVCDHEAPPQWLDQYATSVLL